MLSSFKKNIYRLSEFLHFSSHTHVRSFHFDYQVTLKNLTARPLSFSLVLPVVQDFDSQKVLSKVKFSANPEVFADALYKNKYAIWQIQLESHQTQQFSESFDIQVSPGGSKFGSSTFENYSKLDKKTREQFITSNRFLAGDHPGFQKFAEELSAGFSDPVEITKAFNNFTMIYLDYQNPIEGLYLALEALQKKAVDCGGFATFFVSLCHASKIPARVVSGFFVESETSKNDGKNLMHAWAEFMLPDGRWIPVDPSTEQLFDRNRTRRSGRFGFVGSDRVIFSKGCDIPLVIDGENIFVDILQNPLVFPKKRPEGLEISLSCHSNRL